MFGKKVRQVIRLGQEYCTDVFDDNSVLFVRVSDVVTDSKARFEVPITHDAMLIKGGGDVRYYKSGVHYIFDDKNEKKQWKSGISVDVVYIQKDTRVTVEWGTRNGVVYRDEASNRVITVKAYGEFDISVINPELFFRKIVGVKKEFTVNEFKNRFREAVLNEFTDLFLKTVKEKNLTYDMFAANKKEIGIAICAVLTDEFERNWGTSLLNFVISDISLCDDDKKAIESAAAEKKNQERVKAYVAELERLDDKQWEREKYLRQLELQDKQAYYDVIKVVGSKSSQKAEKSKCPECGAELKGGDKFCQKCGARVGNEHIVCPVCGKINDYTARFCSGCGNDIHDPDIYKGGN